jgi:hypothetical protein
VNKVLPVQQDNKDPLVYKDLPDKPVNKDLPVKPDNKDPPDNKGLPDYKESLEHLVQQE